jgi:DNA-binding transcriptional regulator PaaX
VIFDISTKKRREHEVFRRKIKEMGFLQLQKSVWVFPYRCEDEILFLAKQLGIVEYMEILTVQNMIHKKVLEKRFFHPDK